MNRVNFQKQAFPDEEDQVKDMPVSRLALERAAIAAGRDPQEKVSRQDVCAELAARVLALHSVVDMSGPVPKPTRAFLEEGATIKGQKSFLVGNTFCAHSALQELKIPWLLDVETLRIHQPQMRIKTDENGRRPDFLGLDVDGEWHVFESKGRSSRPQPQEITDWKQQARSIRQVNGKRVKLHIVSAAYVNKRREWELLWVDPKREAEQEETPELSTGRFLMIYYQQMLELILQREAGHDFTPGALTAVLSEELGVSAGLHEVVLDALVEAGTRLQAPRQGVERVRWLGRTLQLLYGARVQTGDPGYGPQELSPPAVERLMSFARDVCEQSGGSLGSEPDRRIFADGLVIRSEHDKGDDRGMESNPSPKPQPQTPRLKAFLEREKQV
ncbi:MAG TPA: hypothetical protein PLB55_03500, partial [Prosthecobacter sp.]|nr:hypothetical protein [Prosthecobacter sp.]